MTRVPLEGGGSVLVEGGLEPDGPVKVGRLSDAVQELPHTVQEALRPVTGLARAALEQLRQAGPDEVVIEFGVDLAAEAGAVISKARTGCHLTVTVTWHNTATATAAADGTHPEGTPPAEPHRPAAGAPPGRDTRAPERPAASRPEGTRPEGSAPEGTSEAAPDGSRGLGGGA
ncbi:CU044_2847 family protein [Streptomyces sp. NPDC097619]|uniref:CU044_2847 family protein n=1 Tax=Streptomyces sp. NPDC097619 TaxID=3157228 RepID=UPI00331A3848